MANSNPTTRRWLTDRIVLLQDTISHCLEMAEAAQAQAGGVPTEAQAQYLAHLDRVLGLARAELAVMRDAWEAVESRSAAHGRAWVATLAGGPEEDVGAARLGESAVGWFARIVEVES